MTRTSTTELLEKFNLKVTEPRVTLLEELTTTHGPQTIEQLYGTLGSHMNKTTLYRTLERFVELGIVYQTDFRDGRAYFELQESHHHHIVCTTCGHTEPVNTCTKTPHTIPQSFHTVTSHVLEFFGTCKSCHTN